MSEHPVGELVAGDQDEPFWTAWRDGERFLLHRCAVCARADWPASCCTTHGRGPMLWVEASGRGTLDSFTVFRRAYDRALAAEIPYVVGVVRLDEGPYFHTRIVGIAPDAVATGMKVRIRHGNGDAFPLFVPA